MARVTVLINRGGGAAASDPGIGEKVADALHKAGIDADIELISGRECQVRCRAIADDRDDLLIVGGGDGTISAAASALAGTETLLGVLPLGTLNHFARDLGLPTDLDQAAALIASRSERRVDVAQMNDRVFINNSAIGLYPLMILDREVQQVRLGRSKRLAMIVAAMRTLARFRHHRLTLTINGQEATIDTPLLFVGNNRYRLDIGAPGERESIDDGCLSVYVMRKNSRRGFVAASIRALLNRRRPNEMLELEQIERLRVASSRSMLEVSLDGEVVRAAPPLEYKIRKEALRVIAP
jgi:YegS/Rv2252/BmrU family lipid kinase